MPDLFGFDIAQEIADAFSGNLVPGTLTKIKPGKRTAGDLTAGTKPTSVEHTFEGFLEFKEVRRKGQIGAETASVLTVITKSIKPATVPAVNDNARLQDPEFGIDITVEIVEILTRDPAAAVFECLVK